MSAQDDFRQAQLQLRDDVGRQVGMLLMTVTLLRTGLVRGWYARANAGIIAAGQMEAASMALDYMDERVGLDRPPDLDGAMAGRLMTADRAGAGYGLVHLWWLLDQGATEQEARETAAAVTSGLAGGDMQMAMRAGMDEGARVSDRRIRFGKTSSPSPCDWCAGVAAEGAAFRHADSVPFHTNCQCGVQEAIVG